MGVLLHQDHQEGLHSVPEQELLDQLAQRRGGPQESQVELVHSQELLQEALHGPGFLRGAGIKELWTAGRLCDAEVNGCDAPHYQPLNINGWFWASTLVQMLPTNRSVGLNADGVRVIGVNEWAKTGPKGLPQPDGFTPAGGLGEEPCMAVIDGAWHDTSCHNRRAIVCEDLPPNNIQFVRNNNPGVFIP